MKYILFCFGLAAASSLSWAKGEDVFGRDGTYYPEQGKPSGLSLAVVESELSARSSFASVESFLGWIKRDYPDHLRHFTFMRKSRSLQKASDSHPRAIVYGPDAKFIFAFNGDPDHEGYQRIEMVQFHEAKPNSPQGTSIEFRELAFEADGVKLSEPNPAKCLRCHSTKAHHLWDPYEDWEGAYGQRDDGVLDKNDKYVFGGNTAQTIALYNAEFAAYQTFLAHRKRHPRYRELIYADGSKVTPYSETHRGKYEFRPNLRLTDGITKMQARLLAGKILAGESCFEDYGRMLVARLMGCGSEPGVADRMERDHAVAAKLLAEKYPQDRETVRWVRFENYEAWHPAVTYLRLFDLELPDWTPQFRPKYWQYFEGERYLHQMVAEELYRELRARDPKLPPGSPLAKSCEALVQAHEKGSGKRRECLTNGEKPAERPLTVRMCASCHEGNEPLTPQFRFEDPTRKRAILERIALTGEKRMPPDRPLSEREREEIRRYLR